MLSNINQRYSFYHIYKQHFYAISLYCLNCVTKKRKEKEIIRVSQQYTSKQN